MLVNLMIPYKQLDKYRMPKIIQVCQSAEVPFHLVWVINNICTNSCSYCPPILHNGKNHNYEWENARQFLKILFNRHKKIHCTVVGGEPSISPFFPELVRLFSNAGHTITVGSNGAKPVAFWKEISPYLKALSFSYHPEFVDSNFIEKVVEAGKLTSVGVRVMMHPKYWNQCIDMYNSILEITHIKAQLPVRILDWGGGSDSSSSVYTQEQVEWFKNFTTPIGQQLAITPLDDMISAFIFDDGTVEEFGKPTKYVNTNQTNFYGYECEIGLRSLVVDHDGSIRRGNCYVGGVIGHLNNFTSITWPENPVICRQLQCTCGIDVKINKRKL
jgi:hypothetical protein